MTQPQGNLRGLKALVGILGVLVVLGTALVIGIVIHRLYAKPAVASMTAPAIVPGTVAPATAAPAIISSRLPAGDYIKAIAAAGAQVAVWVGAPDGDKILLINPATGSVTVAISAAQ